MDSFIRLSGMWWILNSKIWIIEANLSIKLGKTKSQMFHKVLVLVFQKGIANIQPLDIYS